MSPDVPYAAQPLRALRQLFSDALAIAWGFGCYLLGTMVYALVNSLSLPVTKLGEAGTSFHDKVKDAASKVEGVPMVGDKLRDAFTGIAQSGLNIQASSADVTERITQLALLLAVIASVPLALCYLVPWLLLRLRFLRVSSATRRLASTPAGHDVLALRALTSQPLAALAKVHPDMATQWRHGNPDVLEALAVLELRRAGVRAPRRALSA